MKRSLVLLLIGLAGEASALAPMTGYNSLVAGTEYPGYQDGPFASARFKYPCGLAFDQEGEKLYVADPGNQRVREVDLSKSNVVSTLAGTGVAGSQDGPISVATFNSPIRLAMMSGGQLAVYEAGSGSIRSIDLAQGAVKTLAKGVGVRDMVYRPQDDGLYFTTADGKVRRLDGKTSAVTEVWAGDPQLPSPGPICLDNTGLAVGDGATGMVVHLELGGASVVRSALGTAKGLVALASSDGKVYGFDEDGNLLRLGNPSTILKYPSLGGFLFKNMDHNGGNPLFRTVEKVAVGMTVRPGDPRRFFISNPHSIISVTDYDFEAKWFSIEGNGEGLTDFDYPVAKPPGTFRILAIGSSRNSTVVPLPADPSVSIDENINTPRMMTFAKKMEFYLNEDAALDGKEIHFQVLNYTRRGDGLSTGACYEIPDLVGKYGVDLVVGLADLSGYTDYYRFPMTREGIPAATAPPGYMQKKLSERASGPALDVLERCRVLKIPYSEKQDFPGEGWSLYCTGDERMEEDLTVMTGKRLDLFREKLGKFRTAEGRTPRFVIYFVPSRVFANDCALEFWKKVCDRYHLPFLDFSDAFRALETAYGPSQPIHLDEFGNEIVARILVHELADEKLIP